MIRFRRSVKIVPGVRLNFSKSGMSTTIGTRGATMTFSKKGTYANIGLPGTGLYMREKISGSKRTSRYSRSGIYTTTQYPSDYYTGITDSSFNTPIPQVPLRYRIANQQWDYIFLASGLLVLFFAFVGPLENYGIIFTVGVGLLSLLASGVFYLSKKSKPPVPPKFDPQVKTEVVESCEPKPYAIPEFNNTESAIRAFRAILINLGFAHDMFEVLDIYGKGIECLKYAITVPINPAWGDSYIGLDSQLKTCFDDAIIRLATKAKRSGENFKEFEIYLLTDAGQEQFSKL